MCAAARVAGQECLAGISGSTRFVVCNMLKPDVNRRTGMTRTATPSRSAVSRIISSEYFLGYLFSLLVRQSQQVGHEIIHLAGREDQSALPGQCHAAFKRFDDDSGLRRAPGARSRRKHCCGQPVQARRRLVAGTTPRYSRSDDHDAEAQTETRKRPPQRCAQA